MIKTIHYIKLSIIKEEKVERLETTFCFKNRPFLLRMQLSKSILYKE